MSKSFSRLSKGDPALESIEFQSDSYAQDVEVLFAVIMADLAKDPSLYRHINRHENVKAIQDMTFKRMGIKINLILNGLPGAVIPFYPNQYSALLRDFARGKLYDYHDAKIQMNQQYKIIEQALEQTGEVDLQHCRVSGIFSEYVSPLHINILYCMRFKMTPGEVTAIFLHETGHIFTSYEYSNRLNTTNQILAQLLRDSLEKEPPKDYIFRELRKINKKTTDAEMAKIFSGENIVLGRHTMKFLRETVQSQLPQGWYDSNSRETVADIFVTRWGYGKQLVHGFEKDADRSILNTKQNLKGSVLASFCSVSTVAICSYLFLFLVKAAGARLLANKEGAAFLGGIMLGLLSSAAIIVGAILTTFLMWHSDYNNDEDYDDVVHRYKRIRNQLVEFIKHTEIPSEQIKSMIEQIQILDQVIDGKNNYKNVVSMIVDFFKPSSNEIKDEVARQRLLEELSANDLYLKSASLRSST